MSGGNSGKLAWVWFQGDLLGAAIIAIPSALVLAIGFGVTWTFLQE
jgi:hypothetical protein